jgi:hypothetical protein
VELSSVHQLLHGYLNGHERLAGSVTLPQADAELAVRLSDLSGTLQGENNFYPYLTIYPLPAGSFYAVAKTWLDQEAPRGGCVLTRTALVPMTDWSHGGVDLADIVALLTQPTRHDVERFNKPLTLSFASEKSVGTDTPYQEVEGFAAKYFGEGIRPVVWFRDTDPENTLVAIVRHLWPQLRRNFAACTLSLQPRQLAGAPFDILFAPTMAYSRFSKIARENVLQAVGDTKKTLRIEPWVRALSSSICQEEPLPTAVDWPDLQDALGPEPTSVRWLYLLNEMRSRTAESPTAALGTMDIVESLCPEPESKLALKSNVARSAIAAADSASSASKSLGLLSLICERLLHPAFGKIDNGVFDEMTNLVSVKAANAVEDGLSSYETLRAKPQDAGPALCAFRYGIAEALRKQSSFSPSKVAVLKEHELAATDIVPENPSIAEAYLQAHQSLSAVEDILRWLRSSKSEVDWVAFVDLFLHSASSLPAGEQVYIELLSRLSADNVEMVLNGMAAEALEIEAVELAFEKQVARKYPDPVRHWVENLRMFSRAAAKVASSTYELSPEGLAELLADKAFSKERRDTILIEYLGRVIQPRIPPWLFEHVEGAPSLLLSLVDAAIAGDPASAPLLAKFAETTIIPAMTIPQLVLPFSLLSRMPVFGQLCEWLVRSAIARILRGEAEGELFDQLTDNSEVGSWISNTDGFRFGNWVASEAIRDGKAQARAWSWLARGPEALYRSRENLTLVTIGQLNRQMDRKVSPEIGRCWKLIIERARVFCSGRVAFNHSVQALQFSFQHINLPVGTLVPLVFPDVYKAVAEQSPLADEAGGLFSYDWDKAKALRRNIVDAFVDSDWAPSDLALAAHRSFGLRKLFKRVWRKWRGERYIERMIRDLSTRSDAEAVACRKELIALFERPFFTEPWD